MRCTSLLSLLDFGTELSTYSLLDGAQAPGIWDALRQDEEIEIYPLLGYSDVTLVGPILVFHKKGPACRTLSSMVEADSSSAYLSILQAQGNKERLIAHLTTLTQVSHADGSQWIMRYYDPRVLPHWAGVLNSSQRAVAFSPIRAWHYMAADCSPERITGESSQQLAFGHFEQMCLSEEQSAELLCRCAPLMLMGIISQERGSDIWCRDECERSEFIHQVLANAKNLGIIEFSDQKTFILLALAYGENFHESTAFLEMWNAGSGGGLNAMILKMPSQLLSEFGLHK